MIGEPAERNLIEAGTRGLMSAMFMRAKLIEFVVLIRFGWVGHGMLLRCVSWRRFRGAQVVRLGLY